MASIKTIFTNIANAIRTKKGTSAKYLPENMAEEIDGIPTGITPSGKIEITNTEEINVTNYATAQVVDSNLSAENIKKDISILGVMGTFEGSSSEDRFKKFLDTTKSARYLFYYYEGTSVDDLISYNDTENVTNMYGMFYNCKNLQTVPLLNTSKVTEMDNMFSDCSSLQTIPQLNTSNVTKMGCTFRNCSSLQTIPQLNTSNVTNMEGMLNNCTRLQTIPQLNTSKVTDIGSIFYNCHELATIPQLNTSKVTNIGYMFYGCSKLQTIDLTHMQITKVSNSASMCYGCYSLTKLIIRNMDTIPVLNSNAFNSCYHFLGTKNTTYNPQGLKDGRIYVPDDKVDELKSATNWSVYADIIVPLSTLVE